MRSAVAFLVCSSLLLLPGILASDQPAASSTALLAKRSFPGLHDLLQGFSDLGKFYQGFVIFYLQRLEGFESKKRKGELRNEGISCIVFEAALLKRT